MESTYAVVLIDDHPIFRSGLAFEIGRAASLVVVGEADGGEEAIELISRLTPHVAVLDVRMPHLDGIQVLNQLRPADLPTRYVLLSAFRHQAAIDAAFEAGASGYLIKDAPRSTIVDAIEAVARGQVVIDAESQELLAAELRCRGARRVAVLSAREREVVELLADGCSSRQIGERLFIAPTTVKTHVERIAAKLLVEGRTAIVAEALRRGMIA